MRWIFCLTFFLIYSLTASECPYAFTGTHYVASYQGCDHEALTDLQQLQEAMIDAVTNCGATLLSSEAYVFPPDGLTMVLLLSESHASIHTYPEYNSCYIDLFTCGVSCDYRIFEATLASYLKPARIEKNIIER